MDQIRANTPAPIKANLMTEQLSVQMSWGNGGCTRAGSPGDQQSRELGPWAARRSRAMLRANAWGHDELKSPDAQKCTHYTPVPFLSKRGHRLGQTLGMGDQRLYGWGIDWIHPIHLYVRPYVDVVSGAYQQKYWLNGFVT